MKFSEAKDATSSNMYVQFKEGTTTTIRIVTEAIPLWKAFFTDEEGNQKAKVFLTEEAAKAYNKVAVTEREQAKPRFACYVLNRDGNKLQIAELGVSMVSQIGEYQITDGYAFETTPPYDLLIKREGSGLLTKYKVTPARQNTELTEEEKVMLVNAEPLLDVLKKDAEDKAQAAS